ncbi:hypothetical protein PENSOL_c009G00190 [Penicillium solitum]|uniref:Uncharacterized protein n=1 Tax=Penicillium solitum TaxID=60172 RepID=A0A1V6RAW4_9EURO|nr:uncharacterized protein PENSOL_c009G00190 [Penicillium solitum]OQD98423.1 hypothetical protein PENSOL_c009G00190 [Penicillium solitum]
MTTRTSRIGTMLISMLNLLFLKSRPQINIDNTPLSPNGKGSRQQRGGNKLSSAKPNISTAAKANRGYVCPYDLLGPGLAIKYSYGVVIVFRLLPQVPGQRHLKASNLKNEAFDLWPLCPFAIGHQVATFLVLGRDPDLLPRPIMEERAGSEPQSAQLALEAWPYPNARIRTASMV